MSFPRETFTRLQRIVCSRAALALVLTAGAGFGFASPYNSAGPQAATASTQSQIAVLTPYFNSEWRAIFGGDSAAPRSPTIILFSGDKTKTPCGEILHGITLFCPRDNTLYFDAAYLERVVGYTQRETGANADFAAVATLAHEFGHLIWKNLVLTSAVEQDKKFVALFSVKLVSANLDKDAFQQRAKAISDNSMHQEKSAECFAGATLLAIQKAGKLNDDQLHAAIASLRWATDSTDFLDDPATYDLHRDIHELYITDEYDEPYVVLGITDRSYAFSTGFGDGAAACRAPLTLSW